MAKAKSKANKQTTPDLNDRRRSFVSSPAFGYANQGVDTDAGVIRGVAVCTAGEAKGHGVHLDNEFISEVVKHGKKAKQGIKTRFGHPSMSGNALGTFVGRAKNFRLDRGGAKGGGPVARADLHVDPIANQSPEGELADYVVGLADSDPMAFGMSIVFRPGQTYKRDSKGRKVNKPTGDPNTGGYRKARDKWADTPGPLYASCEQLHASDLVDDPAANPDGLFSAFATKTTIAGTVSEFLDKHPEIMAAVAEDPSVIDGFVERYRAYVERRLQTTKGPRTMAKQDNDQALDDDQGNDQTTEDDQAQGDDQAGQDDAQGDDQAQGSADDQADEFSAARKELGRYVEAFGPENAATWFGDGLSFAEALKKHGEAQAETIADLTRKLAAAKADRGEDDALDGDGGDDPEAEDEKAEYERLLKAFGGDEDRAKAALEERKRQRAEG